MLLLNLFVIVKCFISPRGCIKFFVSDIFSCLKFEVVAQFVVLCKIEWKCILLFHSGGDVSMEVSLKK